MPKQKMDKAHIYKANFWGTLKGGMFMNRHGAEYIEGCATMLHIIFLPLSLTLGVGIKTLIDIHTRHELEEAQIENIKMTIRQLDDASFDAFIKNILNYHAQSKSSKLLLEKLILAPREEEEKIDLFTYEKKEEIKNNKRKWFIEKQGDNITKTFEINIHPAYTFSKTEELLITAETEMARVTFAKERRDYQKELIIAYIENNINAGKKLQNIIADEAKLLEIRARM